MIGVACRTEEREIVQEFFELFKTPWEFFDEEHVYEVLIASVEVRFLTAPLVVLFGSQRIDFDIQTGIPVRGRYYQGNLETDGLIVPIYGGLLTFGQEGQVLLRAQASREPAALRIGKGQGTLLRIGYDLWKEVAILLSRGQPLAHAFTPTLELHIALLRHWILTAGLTLVEIPPVPAGHRFIMCLTHDIDFAGIRQRKGDASVWGFLYRASLGSLMAFFRGRSSGRKLLRNWKAVASLPFIYLGLTEDFWSAFHEYATVEGDLRSTFFVIPFKKRTGERVSAERPQQRATQYDIFDIQDTVHDLHRRGFEIGVHGIDAWNSLEWAKKERDRVTHVTGEKGDGFGIRMHWLCFDEDSFKLLEAAGYSYDSSSGYNETVGYKAGTSQVFRPLGVAEIVELPLHIQEMALFSSRRMNLSEDRAWDLCSRLMEFGREHGGVLTLLWHDRSMAPERLWGDFYVRLLKACQTQGAWFATAHQTVQWFRRRRSVSFFNVKRLENGVRIEFQKGDEKEWGEKEPSLTIRLHLPHLRDAKESAPFPSVDRPWRGEASIEISYPPVTATRSFPRMHGATSAP